MASLATARLGRAMRIARVELDEEVVAWLAAVGLSIGEIVTVLRSAILGGPLHVRTSSGGEFAVAREIAERIRVEEADEAKADDVRSEP